MCAYRFRAPFFVHIFGVSACVLACVFFPGNLAWAGIGFQPVNPEELRMTQEPLAPGAWAIILYRQVLRNWVLGMELKDRLACEKFVLVNLLRKRHEKGHSENPRRDFAERECVLTPDSRFVVAYWEDLVGAAPSDLRPPRLGAAGQFGTEKI